MHGGKLYYAYTYNTGITMSMEVPLICQVVGGVQRIFMVNLPYDTVYQLNVKTKVKSLQNKSEYTEAKYHTFDYPKYLANATDKIQEVKNWYIKYCQATEENGEFLFQYLGNTFVVTFASTNFSIYVKE